MPDLSIEQLVLVAGALSALISGLTASWVSVVRANAESAKTRAEVAAMRDEMAKDRKIAERSAQMILETHHQTHPNNGSSIADSTARTEVAVGELKVIVERQGQRLDEQAEQLDRLDKNVRDTAADIRGSRRDIGRLADANVTLHATDLRDRESAEQAHAFIHQRIDDLAATKRTDT